jgi:hypothetical protein
MSLTRPRLRHPRLAAALLLALAVPACVVVPQTREVYDAECRMMKKEVRLETAVVGRFQGCQGDGCVAILVATGAVTAATAVVSGSLALIGNVAYWFESQGRCSKAEPVPRPAGSAASAGVAPAAPLTAATGG